MVQTQVRLLAHSRATRSTLVSTIAQWLGFLGVHAQVTQLDAKSGKIVVSLVVGQPEGCNPKDWQQILENLNYGESEADLVSPNGAGFTPQQQSKIQRLLAYLIQVGNPERLIDWQDLQPQLSAIGLDEPTLAGIRSALKVPQSLDDLIEGLDSDIAAVALPKAVSIATMDRQVNASEDQALTALLQAMKKR